jgi:two-component system, sensor histidine kinase PdtaS
MPLGSDTTRTQHHALQVEPQLLSAVADLLPVLLRCSDAHGRCTYVNRQWLSLTGRRLEEELGAGWTDALHPDDLEGCLPSLKRACEAQQPVSIEYRVRHHDGAWRWLREEAAPYGIGDGTCPGLLHASFDISDHQANMGRLRQLLGRQQVSRRELRHRAVNHSQLILSLLRLQAREAGDPGIREALEAAAARVRAVMLADQAQGLVPDGAAPKLSDCLQGLAVALQPSFERRAISLELSVDDSEVPSRVAAPLALLVNELLMNCLKHAFPERGSGVVKLVGMKAGEHLKVLVAGDGVELPANVEPGQASSSGVSLFDSLAKQIDAEVRVERDGGTCFALIVPINGSAASAQAPTHPP